MKIISIHREYGAGGHTIGRAVAKKLGIEIYDKDIVRATSKESGLDEDKVWAKEELMFKTDSFLRNISPISYSQLDSIFEMEKEAILNYAKNGPCVFIGRCSDAILKEAGYETLNVFLYADAKARFNRVSELINNTNPSAVNKAMKSMDNARRAYYEYYTDKHWGSPENYDLVLNVGTLGADLCADIICMAAKENK